jgi:competence protein ComEA
MKRIVTLLLAAGLSAMAWAAAAVDINRATAEEIAEALNGVGLSKAQAIVAYREANGPFTHADELVKVKGIGLRTVDKNRDNIEVGESAMTAKK